MRFRVVCGFEVTMAIFCPTSRFTSVLLPAFGRPTIATNPARCPAPVFFSVSLITCLLVSATRTRSEPIAVRQVSPAPSATRWQILLSRELKNFTRRASPCPTISESSRATLSADWLPAPQIEIPANRISRPELELSRSRDSAIPQSSLPFHPPILRSARPPSLPHLLPRSYHASPANTFLPSPFPLS